MEIHWARRTGTGLEPCIVTISPQGYDAVLFEPDGVLTMTVSGNTADWKKQFEAFIEQRAAEAGEHFLPFEIEADYPRYTRV